MKSLLRRIKALIDIMLDGLYDARCFFRYSQSGLAKLNKAQLSGRIYAKAHSIEKGLAMPEVRSFFGYDALCELCQRMDQYKEGGYDLDEPVFIKAKYVISSYISFHCFRKESLPKKFEFVTAYLDEDLNLDKSKGGVKLVEKNDLFNQAIGNFKDLALSRHSIRTFDTNRPVEKDIIVEAISLAQRAPSVCNRQGSRVHVVTDLKLIERVLEIQGGNRGFGHEISTVLIVTNDLSIYRDSKERNQGFVDGGLFAMMLSLALHYLKLGSCPLNWSASHKKDIKLRKLLNIPENEIIIVLLGVGHLKDSFYVAISPRRNSEEIIDWH